jgi:hypothetical protein
MGGDLTVLRTENTDNNDVTSNTQYNITVIQEYLPTHCKNPLTEVGRHTDNITASQHVAANTFVRYHLQCSHLNTVFARMPVETNLRRWPRKTSRPKENVFFKI